MSGYVEHPCFHELLDHLQLSFTELKLSAISSPIFWHHERCALWQLWITLVPQWHTVVYSATKGARDRNLMRFAHARFKTWWCHCKLVSPRHRCQITLKQLLAIEVVSLSQDVLELDVSWLRVWIWHEYSLFNWHKHSVEIIFAALWQLVAIHEISQVLLTIADLLEEHLLLFALLLVSSRLFLGWSLFMRLEHCRWIMVAWFHFIFFEIADIGSL